MAEPMAEGPPVVLGDRMRARRMKEHLKRKSFLSDNGSDEADARAASPPLAGSEVQPSIGSLNAPASPPSATTRGSSPVPAAGGEGGEGDGGGGGGVSAEGDEPEYVPLKRRRELEMMRRSLARRGVGQGQVPLVAAAALAAAQAAQAAQVQAATGEGGNTSSTVTSQNSATAGGGPNSPPTANAAAATGGGGAAGTAAPSSSAAVPIMETAIDFDEKMILQHASAQRTMASAAELALGVTYTEPIRTGWTAPSYLLSLTQEQRDKLRARCNVRVEGEDPPPPVLRFDDLKLPAALVAALHAKGIEKPTSIQSQGLPAALAGRDIIGIAFTGSGKTLVFIVPMLMLCMQQEVRLPFVQGEGPYALLLCPSRELAKQTYDIFCQYAGVLRAAGWPELRALLCIGGASVGDSTQILRQGVHAVIATPGRLQHMLNKREFTLDYCQYLVLDEADRLIDLGFEEDLKNIMNYFRLQRQTLLFSATMPKKIQAFAQSALLRPLTISVGRAGAANLDVVQEVDYVREDAKLPYLLEVLQKTPPPVLIFAENKADVDHIHEFLLLKGVDAVAVHGSKDQEERTFAMQSFRDGRRDVLVATDVASKGIDFKDVRHVINYDMPSEIENYVHRIGRTGRSGKTGLATTFINKNQPIAVLLDLKHLLREAKQRVPAVLEVIEDPGGGGDEGDLSAGCVVCGGLGHRAKDCPKLEKEAKFMMRKAEGGFGGGGEGY